MMGNKNSHESSPHATPKGSILRRIKSRSRVKETSSQSFNTAPESTQRETPAAIQDKSLRRPDPVHSPSKQQDAPATDDLGRPFFGQAYSTKDSRSVGELTSPNLTLPSPMSLRNDPRPIVPFTASSEEVVKPIASETSTIRHNVSEPGVASRTSLANPAPPPSRSRSPSLTALSPEISQLLSSVNSTFAKVASPYAAHPHSIPVPPLKKSQLLCFQNHGDMVAENKIKHAVPCMACKISDTSMRWRCRFCEVWICGRCMTHLLRIEGRRLPVLLKWIEEADSRRRKEYRPRPVHQTGQVERGENSRRGGHAESIASGGTGGRSGVQYRPSVTGHPQTSSERIDSEAAVVRQMERDKLADLGNIQSP